MTSRQGVCTNFGNDCSKADNKEKISILTGSDFVCPECGRPLIPDGVKNSIWKRLKGLIISSILGVIVLLTGGKYFYNIIDRPTGFVKGINNSHFIGETINIIVGGTDNKGLKETNLNIKDQQNGIKRKESWTESGKSARHDAILLTKDWVPGDYHYQFFVIDISGKSFEVKGVFKLVAPPSDKKKDSPDNPKQPIQNKSNPPKSQPTLEAEVNLKQGITFAKMKDYENAIKELTLAIEKYPEYAEAYSNRAVAYIQKQMFNKALSDLTKATDIDPQNAMVHYNLAALQSIQKQYDLALDSLDKALEFGFKEYEILRKDPDLKNLRGHSDYRIVLEKHKVFLK